MQTKMRRTVHWGRNVLAYGLWVVSSFLIWLLVYGLQYFLPIINYGLHMENLPFWIITPVLQAFFIWLAFQIVLSDQRLPWIIAATLIGYFLGLFVARYCYAFAYLFFHLIPGNTVREMFLGATMGILVTGVSMAVFQALLLGPTLKRIGRGFALTWIAAAIVAGIVAPAVSVLFELRYYSPSDLYPSLIQSTIASIITGLPLIWFRTQPW